jgi:hypothetical protein
VGLFHASLLRFTYSVVPFEFSSERVFACISCSPFHLLRYILHFDLVIPVCFRRRAEIRMFFVMRCHSVCDLTYSKEKPTVKWRTKLGRDMNLYLYYSPVVCLCLLIMDVCQPHCKCHVYHPIVCQNVATTAARSFVFRHWRETAVFSSTMYVYCSILLHCKSDFMFFFVVHLRLVFTRLPFIVNLTTCFGLFGHHYVYKLYA